MSTRKKLDRLTIRGFQSIRELEDFQLNDLNVLIGANGAGKSNFVNYFRMLRELVNLRLQKWVAKQGGANRLLTFGVKETEDLFSQLIFGEHVYEFTLEPTIDDGLFFLTEFIQLIGMPGTGIGWSYGAGQSESEVMNIAREIDLRPENEIDDVKAVRHYYNSISSWKVFHFHDTSETAGVKRFGSVDDNRFLREDASNLAAYLYRLQREHPETYQQIRKTVQLALPFFDDFDLVPERLSGDDQRIRLNWNQRNSDYPMSPNQLSDGSIRFICLTTALLQPDPPSTIIIDEPELGLHPYAITLLGSLLQSESQRMQIIVSTQSVPLLNEFSIDDLIVVELKDGVSVFNRLSEAEFEHWLEDYTVGDLWEKNVLGGHPR